MSIKKILSITAALLLQGGGIWIFYSIVFILIPSVILATDKAMRNHSVKVILEFGKSIREKIKRFTTRNTVAPAPDVA